MKHRRLPAAVLTCAAVGVVAAGTASATGIFSAPDSTERAVKAALSDHHPKNVIFLLGDGMGTQEITAARYYQGVAHPAQRRPGLPLHRLRHHLVGQAGRVSRPTCPTTTPTRPPPGRCGPPGSKTIDERISQGPSSARERARTEPTGRCSS